MAAQTFMMPGVSSSAGMSSRSSNFAGRALQSPFTVQRPVLRSSDLKVCAAKGKTRNRQGPGRVSGPQMPPTPPVDPDNEEFVLFIRSKKLPQWFPLSIMKGGTTANMLAKSVKTEMGKKMYSTTLTRNIAQGLYKDRVMIEQSIKKSVPIFKATKEFEYGYKIRDRENPNNWYVAEDVCVLPAEDEIPATPVEAIGDTVQSGLSSVKEGFKNLFGGIGGGTAAAKK